MNSAARMVAKGGSARAGCAACFRLFCPLALVGGCGRTQDLSKAEWRAAFRCRAGRALLRVYLNELLLKLLAREDPHRCSGTYQAASPRARRIAPRLRSRLCAALRGRLSRSWLRLPSPHEANGAIPIIGAPHLIVRHVREGSASSRHRWPVVPVRTAGSCRPPTRRETRLS